MSTGASDTMREALAAALAALPADLRPFARQVGAPLEMLLALSELPVVPTDVEAAKFLNVSTRTLRRHRSLGLVRSISLGNGHPRVSRGELARFICAACSNA